MGQGGNKQNIMRFVQFTPAAYHECCFVFFFFQNVQEKTTCRWIEKKVSENVYTSLRISLHRYKMHLYLCVRNNDMPRTLPYSYWMQVEVHIMKCKCKMQQQYQQRQRRTKWNNKCVNKKKKKKNKEWNESKQQRERAK